VPSDSTSASLTKPVAVDIGRLPGNKPLAGSYASDFGALEHFFAGNPADPAAWRRAIAARQRPAKSINPITGILQDQLRARNAPASTLEMAARLDDPRAVAVVTGQQAGLFGGPLYTLLKAISVVRLARNVERTYDVPAIPVFWVDAEDHDLDEIRSCRILDADLKVTSVSLPMSSPTGTPAGAVILGPEIEAVIDTVSSTLPRTDFTEDLIAELRSAYAPGVRLVDGFASWLERQLGELGLVVFDASDPQAKPLVADLFERELRSPGTTSDLARSSGNQLQASGFHAQVRPPDDATALFLLDSARRSIRRHGSDFQIENEQFSAETLLERHRVDPTCLSPNVLLRPVVQDQLFPTVCYVAGPNELAYLGQLREVYAHFKVPMPLIAQRLSASVVDTAVLKFLHRQHIALEELQPRDEAALNRLLGAQLPELVERALSAIELAVSDHMTTLSTEVATVDPTLSGAAESTRGRVNRELNNFRNKVVQAAKRRDQTLRRQFSRAQDQLFPEGVLQERAVSNLYFLNRYGPTLTTHLTNNPTFDTTHHWVISV